MPGTIRGAGVLCAFAVFFIAVQAGSALAVVKTRTVTYKAANTPFEGYLAYDDAKKGKRPGVVVFPAWTGITDNERDHAQRLAKLGYVVLVADTYGKGIHPKSPRKREPRPVAS
jgi:cephalosporin-C deacetylase-like acetyl esterase